MKYIAGSILHLAAAGLAYASPRESVTWVLFLGFVLICLGILEDIVTFMRQQPKKE